MKRYIWTYIGKDAQPPELPMAASALVRSAFTSENHHGQTFVSVHDTGCGIHTHTWNPDWPLTKEEQHAA